METLCEDLIIYLSSWCLLELKSLHNQYNKLLIPIVCEEYKNKPVSQREFDEIMNDVTFINTDDSRSIIIYKYPLLDETRIISFIQAEDRGTFINKRGTNPLLELLAHRINVDFGASVKSSINALIMIFSQRAMLIEINPNYVKEQCTKIFNEQLFQLKENAFLYTAYVVETAKSLGVFTPHFGLSIYRTANSREELNLPYTEILPKLKKVENRILDYINKS